jgi:hypothetical protein
MGGDASASPPFFCARRRLRDGSRLGTTGMWVFREIEAGGGAGALGCLTRAAMRVLRERLKPVLCRIASRLLLFNTP